MSQGQADPRTLRGLRALLSRQGLRLKKGFGQHFLVDPNLLAFIVRSAGVGPGDRVYEVGPGAGALTLSLAEAGAEVVAVEKDLRLAPLLDAVLPQDRVEVVFADALGFPWDEVPEGSLFVSNLPYNIATPLLVRLLTSRRFRRLVVMVQREVARRMMARPGERDYGILSLRIAHHATVEKLRDVPPAVFFPRPEVTSTIVRIEPKGVADDPLLFSLIEAAFRARRRTLVNNLEAAGYDRIEVLSALTLLGLDPKVRGEALSLAHFKRLRTILTGADASR